jgi:hypothetical protein
MKTITCEFCGKDYNANHLECPENCYNDNELISSVRVRDTINTITNEETSPFDTEDMTLILLGVNKCLLENCAEKETAQIAIDIRNKIYQLRDRLILNQ